MYYVLVAIITVFSHSARSAPAECSPSEKGFTYGICQDSSSPQIKITKITATQNGKPVDKSGIDLTTPLKLTFDIDYSGSGIKHHRADQKISQYVRNDNGKCDWKEIELYGTLDDMDICQIIQGDCTYKKHPKTVSTVVNWQDMLGDAITGLTVGRYYRFKVIERDNKNFLNCFWIQSKVRKVE